MFLEKSNQTINHTNACIKSPTKSTTNKKMTPKVLKKDASIGKHTVFNCFFC